MSDHLGAVWRDYRTKVVPLEAPPVQARECRRAFYAGAAAMLDILVRNVTPDAEPTAADFRLLDDLVAELDDFARGVDEGRT